MNHAPHERDPELSCMTAAPNPTQILRFIHSDNLSIYLQRKTLHAPNMEPDDGLRYRTIHDVEIQTKRSVRKIPCGPCGVAHDYVPFYFGYLSPMMLKLKTGQVAGYTEGQAPLIYLVSTAQIVREHGCGYVFSNGHGIATFTEWFDDLAKLNEVDWEMVYQRYWADTVDDPDRQRRKQAEFLVHGNCGWDLIREIVVINSDMRDRVQKILEQFNSSLARPVNIRPDWYY